MRQLAAMALALAWAAILGCNGSSPGAPTRLGRSTLTLTRAPYLQQVTRTSARVLFRTDVTESVRTCYGTQLYAADAPSVLTVGTAHSAHITGLIPGRTYSYWLMTSSGVVSGPDMFFTTDAGPSDPEFAFWVSGDLGIAMGQQEATAASILATSPRAELGLIPGDVVYPTGNSVDYDPNLFLPMRALFRSVPTYPALGNHDWRSDPELHFRAEWELPNNEHYYSFDYGPVHFVTLDSDNGLVFDAAAQLAWLRADLAAHAGARWIFVQYHHPGYSCSYKGNDAAIIINFHPVFDEFDVDIVFMGHAHLYERMHPLKGIEGTPTDVEEAPDYVDPDGTLYIVTGIGAQRACGITPCARTVAGVCDKVSWTHVTVWQNKVTLRQIESATGAVLDQASITKHFPTDVPLHP